MTREKTVVLLSGGMDSAFALYETATSNIMEVTACLWIDYMQRGRHYEEQAAKAVFLDCFSRYPPQPDFWVTQTHFPLVHDNPLMAASASLDPTAKDSHGQPATFLPGRNLVLIGLAATLAYQKGASLIAGGWCSVDVDYPDCTGPFIMVASKAISTALDTHVGIFAPALWLGKKDIVRLGQRFPIPWQLTRSCYGNTQHACGECDSCLVRARAFLENDLRDPLYTSQEWQSVLARLEETQ